MWPPALMAPFQNRWTLVNSKCSSPNSATNTPPLEAPRSTATTRAAPKGVAASAPTTDAGCAIDGIPLRWVTLSCDQGTPRTRGSRADQRQALSAVTPVGQDEDLDLATGRDGGEGLRRSGEGEGRGDEAIGIEIVAGDDLGRVVEVLPPVGGRSLDADLVLLDHRQVDGR